MSDYAGYIRALPPHLPYASHQYTCGFQDTKHAAAAIATEAVAEIDRLTVALAASQAEVARLKALLKPVATGSTQMSFGRIYVGLSHGELSAIRVALAASQPQGGE
jgi:hypothetical protein